MDKHKSNNEQVRMEHAFQHNIYLKKMFFNAQGSVYKGHHHDYDHVTLVASGKVRVRFAAVPEAFLPAEEKEYSGVSMFVTRCFREHEITALEDNTVVCCIHAIRDANGQVIDPPSELKDHQLNNMNDLANALRGFELGRFAFSATPEDKEHMIKRAIQEGTLEEGSGDKLI